MAGGEADIWVCGQCRSVNNLRAKQCYHCRTPQHLAAVDPAAIEGTGHGKLREIALPEFHASRGEAMLASLLILLVAGLNVVSTVVSTQVLMAVARDPETAEAGITPDLISAGSIALATLGVALLALTAWAFWLSRVVAAMPALGLGYPAANSMMAFLENFLPGLNLLRVPPIVRDVIRRLEPAEGSRGDALIFAAWIGLFGGFIVPRVAGWLNWEEDLELAVRNALVIQGISTGLVLIGAIFLVGLIWWIEARIGRRRAQQLAEIGASAPAGAASAAPGALAGAGAAETAPAGTAPAGAASTEPRRPTPAGTPTPFDPMAAPFAPPRVTAAALSPTAAATPFAPTPGASAPAAEVVAGPLGTVVTGPLSASDALLHRPITAVTGASSIPTPIARPADEQADIERFADARPAWPGGSTPTETPAAEPVIAAATAQTPEPTFGAPTAEPVFPAPTAEPEPAPLADAPAPAPLAPAHVPAGPRLHLRVDSGTSMIATLDGESEPITLTDLRVAAGALARADGSAVIVTAGTGFEARSLADQAFEAFTAAQVPTTMED